MADSNTSECLVSVTPQSSVKKKKVLPFIVSACVGFSLAVVLHVEGRNVYPKIIAHGSVLSAQFWVS